MNEYKIYESKTKVFLKLILAFVVAIGFSIAIIAMITGAIEFELVPFGVFILGDVLLVWVLVVAIRKLGNSDPVLILNAQGIKSNDLPMNFVSWKDIEGIFPYEQQGNLYIGVILKEEDRYLAQLNKTQLRLAQMNMKMGFPPFNINAANLQGKPIELLEKMGEFGVAFLVVE